jgi:SiaC family regulatory phosphoprotein
MENLIIKPGIKTPDINFNCETGDLELKGKSIPENSIEFYRPVYEWLDNYAANPKAKTKIIVQLEYFNTSSSKCLLDIFRKLEAINNTSKSEVSVVWLYEEEDEDMMEAGDDYKTIVKLPFEIKKIS